MIQLYDRVRKMKFKKRFTILNHPQPYLLRRVLRSFTAFHLLCVEILNLLLIIINSLDLKLTFVMEN